MQRVQPHLQNEQDCLLYVGNHDQSVKCGPVQLHFPVSADALYDFRLFYANPSADTQSTISTTSTTASSTLTTSITPHTIRLCFVTTKPDSKESFSSQWIEVPLSADGSIRLFSETFPFLASVVPNTVIRFEPQPDSVQVMQIYYHSAIQCRLLSSKHTFSPARKLYFTYEFPHITIMTT